MSTMTREDTLEFNHFLDIAQKALLDGVTGKDAIRTMLDAFGGFPVIAKEIARLYNTLDDRNPAKIKLLMMITSAVIKHGESDTSTSSLAETEQDLANLLAEMQSTHETQHEAMAAVG